MTGFFVPTHVMVCPSHTQAPHSHRSLSPWLKTTFETACKTMTEIDQISNMEKFTQIMSQAGLSLAEYEIQSFTFVPDPTGYITVLHKTDGSITLCVWDNVPRELDTLLEREAFNGIRYVAVGKNSSFVVLLNTGDMVWSGVPEPLNQLLVDAVQRNRVVVVSIITFPGRQGTHSLICGSTLNSPDCIAFSHIKPLVFRRICRRCHGLLCTSALAQLYQQDPCAGRTRSRSRAWPLRLGALAFAPPCQSVRSDEPPERPSRGQPIPPLSAALSAGAGVQSTQPGGSPEPSSRSQPVLPLSAGTGVRSIQSGEPPEHPSRSQSVPPLSAGASVRSTRSGEPTEHPSRKQLVPPLSAGIGVRSTRSCEPSERPSPSQPVLLPSAGASVRSTRSCEPPKRPSPSQPVPPPSAGTSIRSIRSGEPPEHPSRGQPVPPLSASANVRHRPRVRQSVATSTTDIDPTGLQAWAQYFVTW
jgi:hypothetical protein